MRSFNIGAAAAVAALLTGGLVAPAHAADHTLRDVDVNFADTRATGHNEFLKDGLHVWTEGSTSTDKAAGYFAHAESLADIVGFDDPSMVWFGTNQSQGSDCIRGARPSVQLGFDKDGDGDWDGYLVGEPVYGDNWWGSNANLQSDPNSPVVGGGGSPANGTLDQWLNGFPAGEILFVGYSLGSGCYGDGVIKSMTFGDDVYSFTNEAVVEPDPEPTPVVPDTYSSATKNEVRESTRLVYGTEEAGANESLQHKVRFIVKVDGRTVDTSTAGFGSSNTFNRSFPKNTGPRLVTLTADGVQIERVVLHTGKRR